MISIDVPPFQETSRLIQKGDVHFVHFVQEFGGPLSYLDSIGFCQDDLQRLRALQGLAVTGDDTKRIHLSGGNTTVC